MKNSVSLRNFWPDNDTTKFFLLDLILTTTSAREQRAACDRSHFDGADPINSFVMAETTMLIQCQ
jgi:hypothetical protein